MQFIHKNKLFIITYAILVLLSIGVIYFFSNNYAYYKKTIAKVTKVEEKQTKTVPNNIGIQETYYAQSITAVIKNGAQKGLLINIENERSFSGVLDKQISTGDDLFITFIKSKDNKEKIIIEDIKRDKYIVFIVIIFMLTLILIGKRKGLLSLVSLAFNIILFSVILYLYKRGMNILLLFMIAALLFTVISLILTLGINKKSISVITSTLISLIVSMLIACIVFLFYANKIEYEHMEFISAIYDYQSVFYSSVIIGGLGAIMDIAITISSSISELISNNPLLTVEELKRSGKHITMDIMGTMSNVLLFTYICGSLPIILFTMRNGMPLTMAIKYYLNLEMIRALTGSIGIVVSIPVSLKISLLFLKRGADI